MILEFTGEMWFWRGPSPWHFLTVPKDGRYVVPVKASVRKAEGLEVGEPVTVRLTVEV